MIKRVILLGFTFVAALLQNVVHELIHYVAAVFFGVPVLEYRLLTNGYGTSQVVYGTPVAERTGWEWLVIALLPAVLTILVGYLVYLNRNRLLTGSGVVNLLLWYIGALFLTIDPLYLGVLSLWVGGDVNVLEAFGLSVWLGRIPALLLLGLNVWLVLRWREEARAQHAARYRLWG